MNRRDRIEQELREALGPQHLEVVDESRQHNVPKNAETHFNVTVVADAFEGMLRVARHRRIHELLEAELAGGLHALTLTLLTPAEHAKKGGSIASPACLGGSKADRS